MLNLLTDDFLKEINFEKVEVSGSPQYGKAISKKPKGKRIISWNNEGYSCDYFGNKLEPNICFGIEEDCGTRSVFNGHVSSQEQIKLLLYLTH